MSRLSELKAKKLRLRKEKNSLEAKITTLQNEIDVLEKEQERIEEAKWVKDNPPAFKIGDVVMRAPTLSSKIIGERVRIKALHGSGQMGERQHIYGIEYVRKDGSLAKRQPSSSAWESQLTKIEEE